MCMSFYIVTYIVVEMKIQLYTVDIRKNLEYLNQFFMQLMNESSYSMIIRIFDC